MITRGGELKQMSFGENVRAYRIKRGLDQRELALIIGVAGPTISNIERNIKNPSLKTSEKLAHALRCTVDDLLKE